MGDEADDGRCGDSKTKNWCGNMEEDGEWSPRGKDGERQWETVTT